MIPMCSPVIGKFFDTMIAASIDNDGGNGDASKSTSWKVLETALSHLNNNNNNSDNDNDNNNNKNITAWKRRCCYFNVASFSYSVFLSLVQAR